MINKENLSMLHSRPEDEEFHRSRIMFCIKDGVVEVGPKDVPDSHIEWFEKAGWITEKNIEEFLKTNIRGFYLPNLNAIYCYRGIGFGFDDKMKPELLDKLKEMKEALGLNDDTKINLGPKDSPLYNIDWPRVYLGNIRELLK